MENITRSWRLIVVFFLLNVFVATNVLLAGSPISEVTKSKSTLRVVKKITGRVTDEKGDGIPGVSILVKGSGKGTVTDLEGNYSIDVNSGEVLVFSFVGYLNEEVTVGNQTVIDVVLTQEIKSLEEVVVVGYGTQKKAEITSSVASVSADEFIQGATKDAAQLLQGKVAGLTIATTSGDPNANSQILLRGAATLFSSTQPLVLVDGIPGDLNTVAPEDIESIDVLKDGSAAAIYGTRGTNGVILITTRRANGNVEPSIEYNSYVSTQTITRKPEVLNAADYARLIEEGVPFSDRGASTDWIDAITQTPLSHVHNLAFRGGNNTTNYIATAAYRSFEGIIKETNNRTLNGRIDLNHNMYDGKLMFNVGLLYRRSNNTQGFSPGAVYEDALNRNPTEPIKDEDGNWYERPELYFYENPLAQIYESDGENVSSTTRLNGSLSWYPVEDLQLKALVSQENHNNISGYSETFNHISNIRDSRRGFASRSTGLGVDRLAELTVHYNKEIADHQFSFLGGYSYQEGTDEGFWADNYDFPTDVFSYNNIGWGDALNVGRANMGSYKSAWNLIGFFTRATYSYNDKYLFMGSLRHEASSKFLGAEKPWGSFPAVSVGWRLSKEGFLDDINFIDDLKLRAGYGVTGTAPDESFLGVARLGFTDFFYLNGRWVPTLQPVSNPNPYLRWEEKHETNIGLDFSFLSGRVSGSIDYYNRLTNGLLYDYPVPSPPNLYDETTANVGKMENKGLEAILNIILVQKDDFVWNTSMNFSSNRNKLISLENDLYQLTNDFFNVGFYNDAGNQSHRVQVGQPIGNHFGFKVVDITEDGKWIYETPEGERVSYDEFERKEEDKMVLGNGLPKYFAGWNNNVRYKNFDLSVTMRGAFGFQIMNVQRMYYENPTVTSYNQLKSAHEKVFGKAKLNVPIEANSYYLEEGDYWKVDNVSLGYTFNTKGLKYLKSARVYVSSLNTFTFTGYSGMDPEVNRLGLNPGIDERNKYPNTRTFTLGVNVKF